MNPEYPRPEILRQEWLSLDGPWQYALSEQADWRDIAWQGEICVPYPPESPLSGVNDPGYHRVIWYRGMFAVPEQWRGRRIHLHFGAVDYQAKVWVNGNLVVQHQGGHTPFSADITAVLVDGWQEVIVRAFDDPLDLEQPRGKQDWQAEPHGIWYPRTTGIWQPVWIEPLPGAYVERLRITPDLQRFALDVEVDIHQDMLEGWEGLALDLDLSLDEHSLARASVPVEESRVRCTLQLNRPETEAARDALLWTPENPTLFDLALVLHCGETPVDRVESYAALRTIEVREGAFYLNGRPYFLQMVLDQGYWAESNLAAPAADALRHDIELTKAMGFNGVRKHQKIEDPRYLYLADCLGLMVWEELPSAYRFSADVAGRLTQELVEVIARDYNHPCVVAWVPFNESWGIPDVLQSLPQRHLAQALYHLAKALDPTRPVIENDGWEHCCTDLFTIHDYENKAQVFEQRYGSETGLWEAIRRTDLQHPLALDEFVLDGHPVILSEFGGVRMGNGGPGWGYMQVGNPEELVGMLRPLFNAVHGKALAGFCYTQLTDTFQEQNGLLYADRRPKVDPAIIARILREGLRRRRSAVL